MAQAYDIDIEVLYEGQGTRGKGQGAWPGGGNWRRGWDYSPIAMAIGSPLRGRGLVAAFLRGATRRSVEPMGSKQDHPLRQTQKKGQKALVLASGGEGGIRTHGGLQTLGGFQDRCIQPLCHLSEGRIITGAEVESRTEPFGKRPDASLHRGWHTAPFARLVPQYAPWPEPGLPCPLSLAPCPFLV